MFKKLMVGGKETDFKCSAATSILYKRLFGKSLTKEMTELASMSQSAFKLRNQWEKLNEEGGEENKQAIIDLLSSDTSLADLADMTERLTPQMAYIMWLEANKPQRELFQNLTEDAYIMWLSGIDKDDLSSLSGDFIELWNSTNQTHSSLKNV